MLRIFNYFFLADFEGISALNLTYLNSPLPKICIYSEKQMRATYHYGILYQLTATRDFNQSNQKEPKRDGVYVNIQRLFISTNWKDF